MDAVQAQPQQQFLPPSPPPSPPTARRRQKKNISDPFLELSTTPISSPSPPSSPPNEAQEPQEPLLTRIILTPLLFTSFLLSLFLVNRSDRVRRSNSRTTTLLSYFSPSTWIDPEPYQDPTNSTWERRDSTTYIASHDAISPKQGQLKSQPEQGLKQGKRRSWHLHRKIRKVAKLEISDAFEMRGRVIVGILVVLVSLGVGIWMALRWVIGVLWWR